MLCTSLRIIIIMIIIIIIIITIIIIIIIISQTETLTGKHSAIYPRVPAGKTNQYGKGKIVRIKNKEYFKKMIKNKEYS